jgi:hypothetical protein
MKQISAMWPLLIAVGLASFAPAVVCSQVNSYVYNIVQSGNAYPGYFLIAPTGSDTVGVVDNSGLFVFPVNVGMQTNLNSFNNKELTYFSVSLGGGVFDLRCLVRVNAQFQVVDSIKPIGPYAADFHEGYATSDSTALVLGTYTLDVDLSKTIAGGKQNAKVVGAVIQEVTRSGRVLFEWKSFDHMSYMDATEDIDYTQPLIDVVHVNSVIRDTDGSLIISCRHLDEVIKISRTTGQILWRMGGSKSKNNQFRFLNDTVNGFVGFSHQHSTTRTSRGTLLMFDNGNLRTAPRYSRVVEYDVDEQSKTVKKIFEYSPSTPVYAVSMGSVYELPNQNLLIGYGSAATITGTDKDIAAQEIDRTGNVVATVYNIPAARYRPYRIVKSTFGMTGLQRTITTTGTATFANTDSTTCMALTTTQVKKTTVVTVERHHYAPRGVVDSLVNKAFFFPARWTVRLSDTSSLTGSTTLKLGRASRIEDPANVNVLYRPVEGKGSFLGVSATFSSTDSSWSIPFIKQGEYAVVYRTRISPELIYPSNKALSVERRVALRWHRLLYSDAYDVQVSGDSLFTSVSFSTSTKDTTWLLPLLAQNSTYWWRIRKVRGSINGSWSEVWRFTTEIDVPVVLEPDTTKALNLVYPSSPFRWKRVNGASQYQVVIRDTNNIVVFDTTTADTVCYPVRSLPANSKHLWNVRALIGSSTSKESTSRAIATAPLKPVLLYPEPNVFIAPTTAVGLQWRPGAIDSCRVRVYRMPDQLLAVDTTLSDSTLETVGLLPGSRYMWQVNALGVYGPSEPATRMFSLALDTDLARPVLDASIPRVAIAAQQPSRYFWQSIDGATEYHIQAANAVVFDEPMLDSVVMQPELMALLPRASSLYALRVQARRGYSISAWSDTMYLSTIVDSSSSIVPVYPVHGSTNAPSSGVFRFFTDGDYDSYEVQLARDPRMNSIDFKYYCFADSTSYTFLNDGTRYYWRVVGTSSTGKIFSSQVATMQTDGQVSVDLDDPTRLPISSLRVPEGIVLKNNTLERVAHIRVYTVLGQCISSMATSESREFGLLPLNFEAPYFIVVTFSSGKTYLFRA